MKRVLCLTIVITLAGCCGRDLKPAVSQLRATVAAALEDIEKGRVKYSEDKERNKAALEARAARYRSAIRLAEEALK